MAKTELLQHAAVEPVTLDDIKKHLGDLPGNDDDVYLQDTLEAARAQFEQDTGRVLVRQQWSVAVPWNYQVVLLPKAPYREVSRVYYLDADGNENVIDPANYRVIAHGLLAELIILPKASRAGIAFTEDALRVEFVAGHVLLNEAGDALDLDSIKDRPKYMLAKRAVMLMANHFYQNREVVGVMQLHETPKSYQSIVESLTVDF